MSRRLSIVVLDTVNLETEIAVRLLIDQDDFHSPFLSAVHWQSVGLSM